MIKHISHNSRSRLSDVHPHVFLFYPALAESSSGYVPLPVKSALKPLESSQSRELDVDNSSEEQVRTGSPSPPPRSTDTPSSTSSPVHQQSTLSSQVSGGATSKVSQPPANGVQQCLLRAKAAAAAATAASAAQHHRPAASVGLDPVPPALPPKTRKAKAPEAPKVSEHSDRGDSDMDEETYSSSQDKLRVKKVRHFRIHVFLNGLFSCTCIPVCSGKFRDERNEQFLHKRSITRYLFDMTNCLL